MSGWCSPPLLTGMMWSTSCFTPVSSVNRRAVAYNSSITFFCSSVKSGVWFLFKTPVVGSLGVNLFFGCPTPLFPEHFRVVVPPPINPRLSLFFGVILIYCPVSEFMSGFGDRTILTRAINYITNDTTTFVRRPHIPFSTLKYSFDLIFILHYALPNFWRYATSRL